MSKQETCISIGLVHGGFILETPTGDTGDTRTEVFTSQGKLLKAIRTALDQYTLVAKKASDAAEEAAD